ncbi:MAG: HDIG domain-containing protein [Bacteroidales bacterium]|nr:HDIG domain-containing protein [Bacteroidales bacterium]
MNIKNAIRHRFYDIAKILVFIGTAILVYWLMPRSGKFKYEYELAQQWKHEDLNAPFNFSIRKDAERLRKEKEEAKKKVKPIFENMVNITEKAREELGIAFERQWPAETTFDKDASTACLFHIFDTIENQGIVAHDKDTDTLVATSAVMVKRNVVPHHMKYGDFHTLRTAEAAINTLLESAEGKVDKNLVGKLLKGGIRQNVFYSKTLTEKEQDKAAASISSDYGMVKENELIIRQGDIVDADAYAKLNSLVQEYADRKLDGKEAKKIWASQLFLVSLVLAFIALYMSFQHKTIFAEMRNIIALLLMLLLVVLPTYLIMKLNNQYYLAIPVILLAILVGTFFNLRLAFAMQVFAVMLISLVVPNPFQYIFMQLTVMMVTIFSMTKQRIRHRFVVTSLLIFTTYIVVSIAFTFLTSSGIGSIKNNIMMLGLNALLTMLAQPLINIFEKLFGFVTNMTLMELSNTNSPLLRELSKKAPGTFQHSTQVANLCEEVLIEIGGDSVLARTGAMYHDIGKIANPLYFTENQQGAYSPHNDITYQESAEIIIGHVTDGIELAHKAHIPECVVDFIRTHHGTSQTGYFYSMEQKAHPGEDIDPAPFTYHGPAPFSRETAVLMMCDSIEAAMHSVNAPDEEKINAKVDQIINKQMESGQFTNTDLTLRDFETIRKVLKKKLMSIYHVRIAYPER